MNVTAAHLDALLTLLVPILIVVIAHHTFTTVYLMNVLGRAFDPFWKPRMFVPAISFKERYRWTIYYSGAVIFRFVRRTIFDNISYDFRGRVSRTTVLVCVLHNLAGMVILIGGTALAIRAGWWVFSLWYHLPEPAPSHLLPEGVEIPSSS
jgi:hypothetical protein